MSVDDVSFYQGCGLLQPPRRQRGRSDDFGFQAEHIERLRFIQRALAHGFFLEDIECFVDETNLVTCNDVRLIALHRLAEYRTARSSEHPTVISLEKLIASCGGIGARRDCQLLATLAKHEPDQPNRRSLTLRGANCMTGDEGQIKAKREAAVRARSLSTQLTSPADRDRLLAFAAELDAQADALEDRQSPPPAQRVTQIQMQVQQEGPLSKKKEKAKKPPDSN